MGMDEKTLYALNNDLVLSSSPGTLGEKGNGYGLLICKDFIRKHGSDLQIISEKNRGSCFYFFLPEYDLAGKHLRVLSEI